MKRKNIIVLLMITNIIFIVIMCNLVCKNGNIIRETQVIKEMTQSENEANLQTQIDALNAVQEEYALSVQTYKKQIAEAVTAQGVATSENDTGAVIATNIGNIFYERTKLDESIAATAECILEGKKAYVNGGLVTGTSSSTKGILYYLGNVNSSTTFDISKIPGYQNLTLDNFIGNASATHCKYRTDTGQEYRTTTLSTSMSYNATTGVLTVSCPQNSTVGDGVDYSRLKKIQIKVYLYTGKIENI